MSISLLKDKVQSVQKYFIHGMRTANSLATLGHERERGLGFLRPVTSHIRVGVMVMPYRFDVHDVDELTEGARANDLRDSLAIRRVPQHWIQTHQFLCQQHGQPVNNEIAHHVPSQR